MPGKYKVTTYYVTENERVITVKIEYEKLDI